MREQLLDNLNRRTDGMGQVIRVFKEDPQTRKLFLASVEIKNCLFRFREGDPPINWLHGTEKNEVHHCTFLLVK